MTEGTPNSGGIDAGAASAKELSDDREGSEGWRRLHPLSPLLRGGLFVLVLFGVFIANMRDRLIGLFVSDEFTEEGQDVGDLFAYLAAQGLLLLFLVLLVVAILLIVFFSWLAWRFRTFRVTAEAVEERSGILFRQHRRAPLERIQSVNLQRPLLARALGLTQVDVQTAGQGGKVTLRYLSHAHAKELREQILRIRAITRAESREAADPAVPGDGPAGAATAGAATLSAETAPDAAAVGTASPLFPNAAPGSLQAGLGRRASDFVDFDIEAEAERTGSLVRVPVGRLLGSILLSWDLLIPFLMFVTGLVTGIIWHPGAFSIVIPAVLMFFGIGFGQFNRGFSFTLSHSADGIRVGSGLTATNTETLPLRRIHAIEARQPLGWRPFGWWKVRITTAGHSVAQGGQNRMQNVVLPVGLEADVLRVFETLGVPWSAAEASDALSGPGSGFVGSGARSGWVLWFGRRRAGVRFEDAAVGDGIAEVGAGRDGGPTVEAASERLQILRIRRGALTRSLSLMPIARAQSVQLRRPLVHRLLGLASIQAQTVLGPVRMEMRGLDLPRARELFERLAATVVRVQREDGDRVGQRAAGGER